MSQVCSNTKAGNNLVLPYKLREPQRTGLISTAPVGQLVAGFPRRIIGRPWRDSRIALERRRKLLIDFAIGGILVLCIHNRADRALGQTHAAGDAEFRINHHEFLTLILSREDALDRTNGHAGCVTLTQAFFSDNVGHDFLLSDKRIIPIHPSRIKQIQEDTRRLTPETSHSGFHKLRPHQSPEKT